MRRNITELIFQVIWYQFFLQFYSNFSPLKTIGPLVDFLKLLIETIIEKRPLPQFKIHILNLFTIKFHEKFFSYLT